VLAAGGFESNREWLREAWGQNERGEWPADNFIIRGTAFNQGVLLKHMLQEQRPTAWATHAGAHGGHRCPRAAVRRRHLHAHRLRLAGRGGQPRCQRFYDEGEDFWPKRYAIWGRLVAQQPGQTAYSIIDSKAIGRFMPPVFPGVKADPCPSWHRSWVWTWTPSWPRSTPTTAAARSAISTIPRWTTATPKAWRRPRRTGRAHRHRPFYGYALRPGVTFTYLGLKVDDTSAVRFKDQPSQNLFVAGEMMAGNVLGKGYTAGVGMSIGTAFGRIAGRNAALAAAGKPAIHGAVKD
jgi:tricarballylate dehydrogenase